MFRDDPTPADRYAPDLQADPAMRAVSNAFPALPVPFSLGWAIGGTSYAALTAIPDRAPVRQRRVCYVEPGAPRQSPQAESDDGRLRDELLAIKQSDTLLLPRFSSLTGHQCCVGKLIELCWVGFSRSRATAS